MLLIDGTGTYTGAPNHLPRNDDPSFEGDFADLDRDGDLDIVVGNLDPTSSTSDAAYRVYLNDGDGIFVDGTGDVLPGSAVARGFDVEAADYSGDGLLDIYLASRGSVDRRLIGLP